MDIDEVGEALKSKIQSMHGFIKKAYSGFYCSICDAENTKYFDF